MDSPEEQVAARLAGEVIMSEQPGITLCTWRERLGIKQAALARELGVSPSVLSDYERGRRRSPGSFFIRRYVMALIRLDRAGRHLLEQLADASLKEAVLSMKELAKPVKAGELTTLLESDVLTGKEMLNTPLYGYTVVDSIKAIYALSGFEFYRIFGTTTERALVFTKVAFGRSPTVAVRVSPLKPRMVVIHGPRELDPLAKELAAKDRIILALSHLPSVDAVLSALSNLS